MTENDLLRTMLLTNAIHRDLPVKQRAQKITKFCKIARDKSKDNRFKATCRKIISANKIGNYYGVCETLEKAEQLYWEVKNANDVQRVS